MHRALDDAEALFGLSESVRTPRVHGASMARNHLLDRIRYVLHLDEPAMRLSLGTIGLAAALSFVPFMLVVACAQQADRPAAGTGQHAAGTGQNEKDTGQPAQQSAPTRRNSSNPELRKSRGGPMTGTLGRGGLALSRRRFRSKLPALPEMKPAKWSPERSLLSTRSRIKDRRR